MIIITTILIIIITITKGAVRKATFHFSNPNNGNKDIPEIENRYLEFFAYSAFFGGNGNKYSEASPKQSDLLDMLQEW